MRYSNTASRKRNPDFLGSDDLGNTRQSTSLAKSQLIVSRIVNITVITAMKNNETITKNILTIVQPLLSIFVMLAVAHMSQG